MREMTEAFVKYAKEQFGIDVIVRETSEQDTFESLFGASFLNHKEEWLSDDEIADCVLYSNEALNIGSIAAVYEENVNQQQDLVLAA